MKGSQDKHDEITGDLEQRLRHMYPDQFIHRNTEYRDGDKLIGETDLLRFISPTKVVMYEVKTGLSRYYKATEQYRRFKRYHPMLEVKGVYVHPKYGVKRLR